MADEFIEPQLTRISCQLWLLAVAPYDKPTVNGRGEDAGWQKNPAVRSGQMIGIWGGFLCWFRHQKLAEATGSRPGLDKLWLMATKHTCPAYGFWPPLISGKAFASEGWRGVLADMHATWCVSGIFRLVVTDEMMRNVSFAQDALMPAQLDVSSTTTSCLFWPGPWTFQTKDRRHTFVSYSFVKALLDINVPVHLEQSQRLKEFLSEDGDEPCFTDQSRTPPVRGGPCIKGGDGWVLRRFKHDSLANLSIRQTAQIGDHTCCAREEAKNHGHVARNAKHVGESTGLQQGLSFSTVRPSSVGACNSVWVTPRRRLTHMNNGTGPDSTTADGETLQGVPHRSSLRLAAGGDSGAWLGDAADASKAALGMGRSGGQEEGGGMALDCADGGPS
ncbi:hypothetical protein NLU13_4605 [Sarocladium strictum]|uniref:Uncharacterized protein n=1 Tax=Sarocladium strictum TaxID=5046 RepID=A0AA39GJ70_SARSR|nr:hypothetical protein NLU13_4605 [Sarocladium strictum]